MAVLVVAAPPWGTPKNEIGAVARSTGRDHDSTGPAGHAGHDEDARADDGRDEGNRAKLDALVKEMNTASGNAKVDAIAAVVTELVRQQKTMHERMGQMHEQMMSGRGMMGGRNPMPH